MEKLNYISTKKINKLFLLRQMREKERMKQNIHDNIIKIISAVRDLRLILQLGDYHKEQRAKEA